MTDAATDFTPRPEDKFSFGLWTVGWQGVDVFGPASRELLDPVDATYRLAELGAAAVTFHDDDLLPDEEQREKTLERFRTALSETGLVVEMVTTNTFSDPAFKEGAITANNREVRRYALAKVLRNIDLAASLGARTFVMWGGREGAEHGGSKNVGAAMDRFRDALDTVCGYVREQGYDLRFALEPKPNEPRGDIYLATVGSALAFIQTLDHPEMVGVNPEVAHETMAGLNFLHAVAQAWDAGKLFHIDLNDQVIGRYDQDFRFGAQNPKVAFFLVQFLESVGYDGSRHFDAHAYRTADADDVKAFARGCMRTYLILKEKARRFAEDGEIQGLLSQIRAQDAATEPYSREAAQALGARDFDRQALGARGQPYEALDQLVIELLLGVR
jgi:xylose isomerase